MTGCVFCAIIAGTEPAHIVARWPDAIAVVPLNPVVDGHRLVIPIAHVEDAAYDPLITGAAAARAAELAHSLEAPFNLITSAGREATQTIRHLHWHVVPRHEGDGLALPWNWADCVATGLEDVYEAAIDYLSRHIDIDRDSNRWLLDDNDVRGLAASVGAAGMAAGRAQAAADIRAHADKWAPAGGNFVQQRLRRHLGIAERVAAEPMTDEEVAEALNDYFAERRYRAEGGERRG